MRREGEEGGCVGRVRREGEKKGCMREYGHYIYYGKKGEGPLLINTVQLIRL